MAPISKHIEPVPEQKKDVDSSQNQSIGVSRGGRSTKIHAVVDGLGNPCVLMLTGGQVHDSVMLKPALDRLDISQSVVLADKLMVLLKIENTFPTGEHNIAFLPKKVYQILGSVIISTTRSVTW